jgi:hypothetical protein
MSTIYVLVMIFGTGHLYGGPAVVQQEFSSRETCEAARVELAKAHERPGVR